MASKAPDSWYRRHLGEVLGTALTLDPVVVLTGARTSGKSTLVRQLAAQHDAVFHDLDDPAVADMARRDPSLLVADRARMVVIDEFQHVPGLLPAIKSELNRDLRPGRYVLTGSAQPLAVPDVARFLAGRGRVLTLWPLSQGELEGHRETFVDRLFGDDDQMLDFGSVDDLDRRAYIDRAIAGGFPLAVARGRAVDRERWFESFIELVLQRTVVELREVRRGESLSGLLRALAARTGQLLNVADAGRTIGINRDLALEYTRLLELVHLVVRTPAWSTNLSTRVGRQPKLHVTDSGVAAWLLGQSAERLACADPSAFTQTGHLLETFAATEIQKGTGWAETAVAVSHYRTHDKVEVDLILETRDGRVAGIEVKAFPRLIDRDLSGLRHLRDRLGERFVRGVVLSPNPLPARVDDRILALPIGAIWR